MSGEEPAVRRGGPSIATRISQASATLNWVAIGGIAVAVVTGVIAVRPSEPVGTAALWGAGRGLPVAETAGPAPREPYSSSVARDASGEALITGSIQVATAATEKRRGSRQAAESKPAEKSADRATDKSNDKSNGKPAGKTVEPIAAPAPPPAPAANETAPTWSEDVTRSAREECTALMSNLTAEWSMVPPMRTTSCGAPGPITLRSVGAGKVTLAPAAITNCSTAAALVRWMDEHVQPAAVKHFGARVAQVSIAASYDCRNRYGLAKAPLSEHALANAIDLSSFKLTNGKVVTVLGGWGPTARNTQTAPAVGAAVPKVDGKAKSEAKVPAKPGQGTDRMGLGAKPGEASNSVKYATTASASSKVTPAAGPVGRSAEAEFLRGVHSGACSVFGTVLGPEANEAHLDHFHLDMKYRRRSSFCQ